MTTNYKIYEDFTPELKEIWQEQYQNAIGSYNSSYEWCYSWFRHFGQGKKLFIITIAEDETVKVIAPFYRKRNRLYAIGSCPDFYDELPLLYESEADLLGLINFIFEHKFTLELRFIPSDSAFLKYFIRKSEQEKLYATKIYNYTVIPYIRKDEHFAQQMAKVHKKYLKKRLNMPERKYNDELVYAFNCEKEEKYIDEFMEMHRTKWKTFSSPKNCAFIKDLYLNSDFVFLSRLYFRESGQTLAYAYNYVGTNNAIYFSMCAFNDRYSPLAPGFFITYYDLTYPEIPETVSRFDFGRGGTSYKYSFMDKEKVVVCLRADLSWKRHKTIFEPIKMLKEKLLSLI